MNPTAQCPSCHTVFKLNPEVLRASDGWARCGQCSEIFHTDPTHAASHASSHNTPPNTPNAPPSFLQVEDAVPSVWHTTWMRGTLFFIAFLLLLGLGLQVLHYERNHIVATHPILKPYFKALCAEVGCSIQPYREIEAIVIESSIFTRVNTNADIYQVGFTLKNTASLDVATPSVELLLTDNAGQAVVRRVFLPSEFGSHSGVMRSLADLQVNLPVRFKLPARDAERIMGYRLFAFYP
ncbi:MAG: hypothetical protein RIR79_1722 [Pseudomonadota bacterium]